MPGLIIIVVVFVALAVLVLFWMLRWSKDRAATAEELESPATETLEYVVPNGQDPVVVMAALENEGFTTRMDSTGEVLHIHCPDGREQARDRARAVIAEADSTAIEHGRSLDQGRVTFVDER
jgi:hypothetical protein